jgi:hypothetical protein
MPEGSGHITMNFQQMAQCQKNLTANVNFQFSRGTDKKNFANADRLGSEDIGDGRSTPDFHM